MVEGVEGVVIVTAKGAVTVTAKGAVMVTAEGAEMVTVKGAVMAMAEGAWTEGAPVVGVASTPSPIAPLARTVTREGVAWTTAVMIQGVGG